MLLKQREVIALTARLNERDETIIRMQEELKAYDSEYRRVEDALDAKTVELIALRRAAMQHSAESPHRNPDLVNALGEWAGTETATVAAAAVAVVPYIMGKQSGGGGGVVSGSRGGATVVRTASTRWVVAVAAAEVARRHFERSCSVQRRLEKRP